MHSVYDDEYYDFESIEGGGLSDIDDEYTAYTPAFNAENEDEDMEGGERAVHDHKTISYNPYEFVSKCCKEVDRIQPGQSITIGVKFNSTTEETSISGDILRAFHNSIPRFATDPTCELCERKCAKCSTKMRYLRDRKGDMWYVCSNKDCRHVDTPNDLVIVDE